MTEGSAARVGDILTCGAERHCWKVSTAEVLDGRVRAHDNERAGGAPTTSFLHRLGQVRLVNQVAPLVDNHLAPVIFGKDRVSDKALRKLVTRLDRLDDLLAAVARADQGGRPPRDGSGVMAHIDWISTRVAELGLEEGRPRRLARGEHLIELGRSPRPQFRQFLDQAYDTQLAGEVKDEDEARAFLAALIDR